MTDFIETYLSKTMRSQGDYVMHAAMSVIPDAGMRVQCMEKVLSLDLASSYCPDETIAAHFRLVLDAIHDYNVEGSLKGSDESLYKVIDVCRKVATTFAPRSAQSMKQSSPTWRILVENAVYVWADAINDDLALKWLEEIISFPRSDWQINQLTDAVRRAMPKNRLERLSVSFSRVTVVAIKPKRDWLTRTAIDMEEAMAHAMVACMPPEAVRRQAALNVALRDIPEASFQRILNEAHVGQELAKAARNVRELAERLMAESGTSPCDIIVKVGFTDNHPFIDVVAEQRDNNGTIDHDGVRNWGEEVFRSIPEEYKSSVSFSCSGSGSVLASRK